jgi:hypothetical protein
MTILDHRHLLSFIGVTKAKKKRHEDDDFLLSSFVSKRNKNNTRQI